jgi:hypothetical protein
MKCKILKIKEIVSSEAANNKAPAPTNDRWLMNFVVCPGIKKCQSRCEETTKGEEQYRCVEKCVDKHKQTQKLLVGE